MTIFRDDLVMLLPELRDLAKVLSDLDGLLGRHPSMLFEHRRIAGLMHLMPNSGRRAIRRSSARLMRPGPR